MQRPIIHLIDNQVIVGMGMRSLRVPAFLVLTILTTSLSGCLGLLQSREALEGLREDVYQVPYPDKIDMTHTFTDIEVQPYTNQTTFTVDDSVQKIDIYFKVSFADGGLDISCVDGGLTRYVQAQVTTPSGGILWSQDVCEDVPPTVDTFEPDPMFETGDWQLEVESRGWGESTFGALQDNFIIVITVHRICQQFPLEDPCDA